MLNQKTLQMFPQNCNMLVKVLSYLNSEEEDQNEQELEKKQKVYEILRTSMQLLEVQENEEDDESEYIPVSYQEACFSQQSTQKSQQSQYLRSPLQTFTQHFQNQSKGYGGKLFTLTDETEHPIKENKPTHTRGPSKIQEILQDLQANVADDIMKMANDIIKFTENSSNTNGSAQFMPSDKKSKQAQSEKKPQIQQKDKENKNQTTKDGFKIFHQKQNSQKQLSTTDYNNQEYNTQTQNQKKLNLNRVCSQPNVENYSNNSISQINKTQQNNSYSSNQNVTLSSIQKNKIIDNDQIFDQQQNNYHSAKQKQQATNSQQSIINNPQSNYKKLSEQKSQNCNQSQRYSSQKNTETQIRDSLFSRKSKQHEIDEFDYQDDFVEVQQTNIPKTTQNFDLNQQFNYSDQDEEYQQQEQSKLDIESPNLNISKKLEKDNLSINNSNNYPLNQQSDQKSYQDFTEPCQKTQESEKKIESNNNPVQKKKIKRRKKSRIPKNLKYFLDIIEEQSNDYYTPDKSLLDQSEGLDTIQSVPNFGESERDDISYRSDRKNFTISEGNKFKIKTPNAQEIQNQMKTSESFENQNNTLINQTLVNFEDVDQILNQVQGYKTLRQKNQEEEAILASWSRVCNEIIRKNLLPVTLDLERIQNQLEYQQQNQHCSKRFQFNRKHTQKTEQNSIIENSCVIIGMDQQQCEKSQADIQFDENDETEMTMLNKQFSPNFSDVCKRMQFTGIEENKILQPRSQLYQNDVEKQILNPNFDHNMNFQF